MRGTLTFESEIGRGTSFRVAVPLGKERATALTEAAIVGSTRVIDALLKAGADPNTKNPEGETPLMAVARSGNVDAARRLL
jgi:ankyrin repeat protein